MGGSAFFRFVYSLGREAGEARFVCNALRLISSFADISFIPLHTQRSHSECPLATRGPSLRVRNACFRQSDHDGYTFKVSNL